MAQFANSKVINRKSFALIDCNNFYVSCERAFNPKLEGVPVVVLSNNDGCIISRSNEAKKIGIPMGAPVFKVKDLLDHHHVKVYSSNYPLYADMSHRIISILSAHFPEVEIYSIDEAFIDLTNLSTTKRISELECLLKKIEQGTGIPISIGLAPTKVLSKIANKVAKNLNQAHKIYEFKTGEQDHQKILKHLEVSDVWGIGSRYARKMKTLGMITAHDLQKACPNFMKKKFNINVARIIWELQGVSCLGLEDISDRKSYRSSRSFGSKVTSKKELWESISSHIVKVCEKMRRDKVRSKFIKIFIQSSKCSNRTIYKSQSYSLETYSSDTFKYLSVAKVMLDNIYQENYLYSKAGVCFLDIANHKEQAQKNIIECLSQQKSRDTILKAIDKINQKFGPKSIKFACQGTNNRWAMKCKKRSPCYTTRWDDLVLTK